MRKKWRSTKKKIKRALIFSPWPGSGVSFAKIEELRDFCQSQCRSVFIKNWHFLIESLVGLGGCVFFLRFFLWTHFVGCQMSQALWNCSKVTFVSQKTSPSVISPSVLPIGPRSEMGYGPMFPSSFAVVNDGIHTGRLITYVCIVIVCTVNVGFEYKWINVTYERLHPMFCVGHQQCWIQYCMTMSYDIPTSTIYNMV